jgi:hypothetical protein
MHRKFLPAPNTGELSVKTDPQTEQNRRIDRRQKHSKIDAECLLKAVSNAVSRR